MLKTYLTPFHHSHGASAFFGTAIRPLWVYSRSAKLMGALDSINQKYSKGTIKLASEGVRKAWVMKRGMNSPNYTGDWNELPFA